MFMYYGEEYLTRQEFADAIGVNYTTVMNYTSRGIIEPALIVGKKHFFKQEQVNKYWQGEYMPVKRCSQ